MRLSSQKIRLKFQLLVKDVFDGLVNSWSQLVCFVVEGRVNKCPKLPLDSGVALVVVGSNKII